ncbi:MAG TPA: outer membrane protein transport protein [Pirellulaceae bacterium]|nr:outer membrane protein transport protein [Pirellulaceae bacterium]
MLDNFRLSIASVAFSVLLMGQVVGQGIIFPFAGPTGRAMGGASTGSHLDAIATTYWNPAAMADAGESELSVGVDLLFPSMRTDSSIPNLLAGSSTADPGPIPIPQIGWIQKTCDPCLTYGLSIATVGGAKTNYPASFTNPLFFPQSNMPGFPGGLGRVDTSVQFMQIMPSVAYMVSDNLSIGFGPTLSLGQLVVDPFVFAAPDDADGSGQPRCPIGSGAKMNWGGGFQVSAYYRPQQEWSYGFTFRSPQWMERIDNLSTDENGFPRVVSIDVDLPMVISIGAAYHGIPDTIVGLDVRYVGNEAADGFGNSGFNPDGSLAGVGFSDQYMIGVGARRRFSDLLTLGGGYTFSSSPMSDSEAMIAALAPLHYQHVYHLGGAIHVAPQASVLFAYSYSPTSTLSGPIFTPMGAIPGSNVTTSLTVHVASLGISVRY